MPSLLLTSVGYCVSDYLACRVARRVDAALLVLCSQSAQVQRVDGEPAVGEREGTLASSDD
jgi:hypothetical protein